METEKYLEALATMHAVDIKRELIIPAIEQIIDDYKDASHLPGNTQQEERDAVADQAYWTAILYMVKRA